MPGGSGFPSVALGSETTSGDGVQFSFFSAAAPLLITAIAVLALTIALMRHSVAPMLLVCLVPIFLLRTIWRFLYKGPTVERRVMLFGLTLWRRTYPLEEADAASTTLIEDSLLFTARPSWYRLNLWSSALGKDQEIMRSNQPDDLGRTADLINEALRKVRAGAAS
jgi:hypothetical protein